jgi:5-methylthioadenosine/S-adenosylhomocysteine deaminase
MAYLVDRLILHAHLLTMAGAGVGYLADGAVAIHGDRLIDVGPSSLLRSRYAAHDVVDAAGQALLPGFIDAHMHSHWTIGRGVAQDIHHWMQKGLAPYAAHLAPEAALAGTRLALLEAVRAGTTTVGDYALPLAGWPEVFAETGIRAVLTATINALPAQAMAGWRIGDLYPLDERIGQQRIDAALKLHREWHESEGGRITVLLGPQGADMLPRDQLLLVKRLAVTAGVMLHMHVAQGDREIDQMLKRYGRRTTAFLEQIGYLDDQLLAVHLTEADEEETDLIAHSGAKMVLCSGSIGIIDGIVPPAVRFRSAGGLVALGSDQAAGNNCHNLFNEMKLTALFNKIRYRDPTVLPAWEVLRLATIEGAQALGMAGSIGSLEAGKQADLILVDLNQPNLQPVLDDPIRTLVPNLVYAANGSEVDSVMVAGRFLMRNRQMQTMDAAAVMATAQREARLLAREVAADPLHREMALLTAMAAGQL